MVNELSVLLRNSGLKATPTRRAVLGLFSNEHCQPENAEQIYSRLKGRGVNLVTIYRTLSSLEEGGILKRVDLRKDSVYYELVGHHHHHIVCTLCEKVESFDFCQAEKVTSLALQGSKDFSRIDQHSLELFGVCKVCSTKEI